LSASCFFCPTHLQEYLQKLKAIRQQNYMERKRIQHKAHVFPKIPSPEKSPHYDAPGEVVRPSVPKLSLQAQDKPAPFDAEERRRKIAALKVRNLDDMATEDMA